MFRADAEQSERPGLDRGRPAAAEWGAAKSAFPEWRKQSVRPALLAQPHGLAAKPVLRAQVVVEQQAREYPVRARLGESVASGAEPAPEQGVPVPRLAGWHAQSDDRRRQPRNAMHRVVMVVVALTGQQVPHAALAVEAGGPE